MAAGAILGFIAPLLPDLLGKIPTGRGKRKAAMEYMRPEIQALSILRGHLELAANRGDTISGFALQMLADRLAVTQGIMQVTVDAIGDGTPEEDK